MDKEERLRLKRFLEDNLPDFYIMKKAGFFPPGTRKTDYEKIAERYCQRLGYQTIYEYASSSYEVRAETSTAVYGKFSDTVNKEGDIVRGEGFHLSTIESEFSCPICECPQSADDHASYRRSNSPHVTIKCKGCKRKLSLYTCFTGKLHVSEK